MASAIIGGLLGGVTAGYSLYEQKKSSDQSKNLAQQQLKNQQQAYNDQRQQLEKENQKTADVDALLEANTISTNPSTLTSPSGAAPSASQLQKNSVLGA